MSEATSPTTYGPLTDGGDGSTPAFGGNKVARAIFRTFEVMVASLTGFFSAAPMVAT